MEDTLVYVWAGLGTVVGTLILVAAMLWASKATLQQAREVWQVLRGYRRVVEAGIDDPSDPLIRELARLSQLPPGLWSAFLTTLLRALADGLDELWALSSESASEQGNSSAKVETRTL